MPAAHQPVRWPNEVDEILSGDLVVAVGSPTPKGGVVLNSVTPIGMRDRDAGTVSFTTSLGFGRKLERIAADPRIAISYHTRQHGHSDVPGVALVQGVASVRAEISDEDRTALVAQAAAHLGQVAEGRFWDWWLAVYYFDRVIVDVAVRRIVWWPDGVLDAAPVVHGDPLPSAPPGPQAPPRAATTPRVRMRTVRRVTARPHLVLGYLQYDGMPVLLPVEVSSVDDTGVLLDTGAHHLPVGGRRAGFLAHAFQPRLIGLSTATHTGWLEVDDASARWTPHTRHAFTAPPNKTLLLLGNGAAARWGYRQAVRNGRAEVVRYAAVTRSEGQQRSLR